MATFGGIDETRFEGKISYSPVRRKGYWEVELEAFSLGKEEMELEGTGAAIDTGTSLIALPSDIAEIINKEIGATKSWNGQYTVPCDKVAELPDIAFTFSGKKYGLSAKDYILQVQGTCISSFTGLGESHRRRRRRDEGGGGGCVVVGRGVAVLTVFAASLPPSFLIDGSVHPRRHSWRTHLDRRRLVPEEVVHRLRVSVSACKRSDIDRGEG